MNNPSEVFNNEMNNRLHNENDSLIMNNLNMLPKYELSLSVPVGLQTPDSCRSELTIAPPPDTPSQTKEWIWYTIICFVIVIVLLSISLKFVK
jgi:hypothetical protein